MAGFEDFLSSFLSTLPQILSAIELSLYAIAVFFYGGMAVKGLRYREAWIKWPLMTLSGLLCLAATSSLAGLFPLPKGLELLKLDAFFAGLLSSATLALSFYLMTHDAKVYTIPFLAKKLEALKAAALSGKGLGPISDAEAEKIASGRIKGEAIESKLSGSKWYVKVEAGSSIKVVEIDAIDGAVEKIYHHNDMILNFLLDWKKSAGLAISLLLLVAVMFTFKSLPSISSDFEKMGISQDLMDQLKKRGEAAADTACKEAIQEATSTFINTFPEVKDNRTRQSFQKMVEGKILSLRSLKESKGMVALTDDNKACVFSRESKFCVCLEVRNN